MSRIAKSTETQSIYSGCQGQGEKAGVERKVIANEHRVSFWGGENVLELDNGDNCITLQIHQNRLNCTL